MVLDRSDRRDRLPRRARRIRPCEHAVDARIVLLRRSLVRQPRGRQRLRRHVAGEDGRLVRRRRRHREDGAVPRIERDDRAAARSPLALCLRGPNPVVERALGRLLQVEVDRQPQRVTGSRGVSDGQVAHRMAARVDAHARLPVVAAQVAVVLRLDADLADHVPRLVALHVLQLLRGNLAHVPENLRGERLVWVMADVRR